MIVVSLQKYPKNLHKVNVRGTRFKTNAIREKLFSNKISVIWQVAGSFNYVMGRLRWF